MVLTIVTRYTGKWITVGEQWQAYLLHFITATPFVLAVSFVMFACVERPFMAWRPKWGRTDTTPEGAASASGPKQASAD